MNKKYNLAYKKSEFVGLLLEVEQHYGFLFTQFSSRTKSRNCRIVE